VGTALKKNKRERLNNGTSTERAIRSSLSAPRFALKTSDSNPSLSGKRSAVGEERVARSVDVPLSSRTAFNRSSGFDKQLPQERAVASRFVLAVTSNGEVGLTRHCRKQPDQPLSRRLFHFAKVFARVTLPPFVGPLSMQRPRPQLLARRKVGNPYVVPVAAREVGLFYPARRPTDRAESKSFIACARCAQPNDADRQLSNLRYAAYSIRVDAPLGRR
jgi:hypothetical protein